MVFVLSLVVGAFYLGVFHWQWSVLKGLGLVSNGMGGFCGLFAGIMSFSLGFAAVEGLHRCTICGFRLL